MADNLSEVLKMLVSDMDKGALSDALPYLKKIMSTQEGRLLANKIQHSDRDTLARLLKKLKSGGNTGGLKQAADNPEIIRDLIRFLDGEGI